MNILFLKDLSDLDTENKKLSVAIALSLVLSVICICAAIKTNPTGCELFSSNVPGPQMCHTIPMPEDCFSCKNIAGSYASSIMFGIGICLFFLPIAVWLIHKRSKSDKSPQSLG